MRTESKNTVNFRCAAMQGEAHDVHRHAQKSRKKKKTTTKNQPQKPPQKTEKVKARQKMRRVSGLVLEEGENASWQHLRVICNNRSLSFSE